jgi:hypothetical protein
MVMHLRALGLNHGQQDQPAVMAASQVQSFARRFQSFSAVINGK